MAFLFISTAASLLQTCDRLQSCPFSAATLSTAIATLRLSCAWGRQVLPSRFYVRVIPVPVFLFQPLKRCQLAIKKSLNQLMQCADLPMPFVVHAQEVELIVHVVARSVFLVPSSFSLCSLLCQLVKQEQEILWLLAPARKHLRVSPGSPPLATFSGLLSSDPIKLTAAKCFPRCALSTQCFILAKYSGAGLWGTRVEL